MSKTNNGLDRTKTTPHAYFCDSHMKPVLKTRPMTEAEEDSFLDEFPFIPNNRLTSAEKQLMLQYGREFGQYGLLLNAKGGKA